MYECQNCSEEFDSEDELDEHSLECSINEKDED